jgi:ELWxxDGT repeat protein
MKTFPAALALLLAGTVAGADAQTTLRATLVKDFNTAAAQVDSSPRDFVVANGKVYFSATRPQSGRELYALDAPGAQPRLVAELAPAGASSNPSLLGIAGGGLILAARAGNTVQDDLMGPPVGYALNPITGEYTLLTNTQPEGLGSFAGKVLLFTSYDNTLLATDGTVPGTQRLLQGPPDDASSVPRRKDLVCLLPDRIMFMARREGAWQLWLSNGETLGTGLVTALPTLAPVAARSQDGACYFLTARSGDGWDLWLSNGTAGGTGIVAGSAQGTPFDLAIVNGQALVLDVSASLHARLWRAGDTLPLAQVEGYPRPLHHIGSRVLLGFSWPTQTPVWVSDGTPAGTRQVQLSGGAPLLLQSAGDSPGFANAGDRVLTNDSEASWRIDAAAALAEPLADGTPLLNFSDSASLGGVAFAAAYAPGSGIEPWRSDGSTAGTQLLADLATATARGVDFGEAVTQGNVLVLSHVGVTDIDDVHHGELWRTDGSATGTWALPPQVYGGGSVEQVQALGHEILFSADTVPPGGLRQLYRTRTDFLQTRALPATTLAWPPYVHTVGQGGAALFLCGQPAGQRDLCAVGAQDEQILTLQYALSGEPQHIGSVGNLALYFVPGQGLLRSDGTAPGTWLLRSGLEAYGAVSMSVPLPAQALGTQLLFQACEGTVCGLWASDGTPGGTLRLSSLPDRIHAYALFGNRVLFLTTEPRNFLWTTDGTSAGTRVVTQLSQRVTRLTTVGAYVHLVPDAFTDNYIVSDGTAAGTRYVPRPPSLFPAFGDPVALDANTALFGCNTTTGGDELCAIDADGSNLRPAVDIYPGPVGSQPRFVARTGDALYFSADDGLHGRELWRVVAFGDAIFADGFEAD